MHLVTFERVAVGARTMWAFWLAAYLTEETQAAYTALGDEHARDYNVVKAAILDPVGQSTDKYCKKCRVARIVDGNRGPGTRGARMTPPPTNKV